MLIKIREFQNSKFETNFETPEEFWQASPVKIIIKSR